jgi:hypothetical protein
MKRAVFITAAVILLAVIAYVGFTVVQKRDLQARVAELVQAASGQLTEALAVDISAPTASQAEWLDKAVTQAEARLQQLRALPVRRDRELVEVADPYVAGVLEVLRRQAGTTRHRARFTDDRRQLDEHVARVGARTEDWLRDAIRLRKRLNEAYYDYELSVTSLGNMLAGQVQARRKLTARLPAVPLPEEAAITQARERALAAASATRQEMEQARSFVKPG